MLLPLRHVVIFEGFGGAELPQRRADDEDRQQDQMVAAMAYCDEDIVSL